MTESATLVNPPVVRVAGDDILRAARDMGEWLASQAEANEAARRLTPGVVARLREAGFFRMNMPRAWGGPEMTSMEQVEVIEELSRHDSAVGWCVMIGCDSGIYSAYLDDAVARKLYTKLDCVQAGWIYPVGMATRVSGGCMVSGSWLFGSGSQHADVIAAGCVVYENGRPVIEHGQPMWRVALAPASEFEIVDTWHTTGMRGTGSHDYRCRQLFVPDERIFSFHDTPKRDGTLWRRPDTFLRKMAGIPLGTARAAIDAAVQIVQNKTEFPSARPLIETARVQTTIAEAETLLGAARSYVFSTLTRQWERLDRREELTREDRVQVWLARTNAFQASRRVCQLMYDLIGGPAIYSRKSILDRCLRDANTMVQHICGQTKAWEGVGGYLLGAANAPTHPLL